MDLILAMPPIPSDHLGNLLFAAMPLLLMAWLVWILWGWGRDFINRKRPPDTP
jgi:hypothetical protein